MNLFFIMPLEAAAQPGPGSNTLSIAMMVAIFLVMYFFMIRPQQKKQKELAKFRDGLKKGDKVITAGGIYAKIKDVNNNIATVEIANNVEINIDKSMLMRDTSDVATK